MSVLVDWYNETLVDIIPHHRQKLQSLDDQSDSDCTSMTSL